MKKCFYGIFFRHPSAEILSKIGENMTSYSGAISEQILVVKVRTNLCQYHYFEDMERLRLRSPVVRALNSDHWITLGGLNPLISNCKRNYISGLSFRAKVWLPSILETMK